MKYNYLKENVCVNIQDSKMFETFLKDKKLNIVSLFEDKPPRIICKAERYEKTTN